MALTFSIPSSSTQKIKVSSEAAGESQQVSSFIDKLQVLHVYFILWRIQSHHGQLRYIILNNQARRRQLNGWMEERSVHWPDESYQWLPYRAQIQSNAEGRCTPKKEDSTPSRQLKA